LSLLPIFKKEDEEKLEALWSRHHSSLVISVRNEIPSSIKVIREIINNWLAKHLEIFK
jgi:hypothetical protein